MSTPYLPLKRPLTGGQARAVVLGRERVAAEDAEDGRGYHDGLGCCGADLDAPTARSRSCPRCGGTLMGGQRCECGHLPQRSAERGTEYR